MRDAQRRPGLRDLDWLASAPFIALHLLGFTVLLTGVSWPAVIVGVGLYIVRMFGITAGYHRYFAHKSYRTSRIGQFCLAFLGTTAVQKGPLWWAGHHRHHHKYSDAPEDLHSPKRAGLFWSHVGWFLSDHWDDTPTDRIRDFARYPELRFLDKWHFLGGLFLATAVFFLGYWMELTGSWGLAAAYPWLATTAMQMLVVGFLLSTLALYHGTFCINSLTHLIGKRRYQTGDDSRNSFILALITLGEGWHNNHHYYQASERQGFFWWEIDISHYILRGLSCFGLVWDLKGPADRVLALGPAGNLHQVAEPTTTSDAPGDSKAGTTVGQAA